MSTSFLVKPFSMSIGVSGDDAQPTQLDKAGAYDDTRTWRTGSPRPTGYAGEIIKRNNPLLISFKLPQQVCSLTNAITGMSLSLRYSNGSSVPAIRCIMLPFVAKRANQSTVFASANRTIGYNTSAIANIVSNNEINNIMEVLEKPLVSSSNSSVTFNTWEMPGISSMKVQVPTWYEYLKSLASSNSDPVITFAVYPSTDTGNLYIIEDDDADPALNDPSSLYAQLYVTTSVSGGSYANDVSNNNLAPSTLAPIVAGKEDTIGTFKYSAGLGMHGDTRYKDDGSFGLIDKGDSSVEFAERSAHVATQFIAAADRKINLLSNGRFQKGLVNLTTYAPFKEPYGSTGVNSCLAGWTGYNGTSTNNITMTQESCSPTSTGLFQSPFGFDPIKFVDADYPSDMKIADVRTFDATNFTNAWQRQLGTSQYWQYSCVFQNVGCQLEEEEDYLLEAWVKPCHAHASNGSVSLNPRIRMSFLTGFQPEPNVDDGLYVTHHTGGSNASDDAEFGAGSIVGQQESNATWQRLWVKIKLPRKNSLQRTTAFFKDSNDPSFEARELLVSDPPYFQNDGTPVSKKMSHCEVRFDVVPYSDSASSSYRRDTRFLLANITLTKLSGREYDEHSPAFSDSNLDPIEISRSGGSSDPIALQDASYYVPLRGEDVDARNTSMLKAIKNEWVSTAGNDQNGYDNNRYCAVKRIELTDTQELGGPFSSPRKEYLYHFSPSYYGKDGSGKYWRGAHLGLRVAQSQTLPASEKVGILNPNHGTIDFWYSPVHMNYAVSDVPGAVVSTNGRPIAKRTTGTEESYRPWLTTNRFGDDSVLNDGNYSTFDDYLWLGGPKHIMTFCYAPSGWSTDTYNANKEWVGPLFNGAFVSFFRQGRMIFCLIAETGFPTTPWNNQHPTLGSNSQSDNGRFVLLKYQMPENLFKGKNVVSEEDTIPTWFNVRLVWGARQELYVNGELVDFNGLSGLFTRPARNVDEMRNNHNNYVNALWIGTAGIVTADTTWDYPLNYCDSMILSDIVISETAKHQTKFASSLGKQICWNRLENKHIINEDTIGGIGHAAR